jgi:light-regulated signal transduction histidine kinase (bacteriophytochrome)
MNLMLAELLEYEKLSGSVIVKEKVNLKKMFESVFGENKTENSVLEFQTGIPAVFADKKLIRHVVENLISNALKFSSHRECSKIIVGCKREGKEYTFYIMDNGIGVDMRYADKLFNLFERQNRGGGYEGHGIGLASVKLIIEAHKGRTWIDGKVDVGTTVFFTLPVGH